MLQIWALCFALGGASLWWAASLPPQWLIILTLSILSALAYQCSNPGIRAWLLLPLIFVTAGVGWVSRYASKTLQWQVTDGLIGKTVPVEGRIASLPKHGNHYTKFVVKTDTVDGKPAKQKIMLGWYGHAPELKPGQKWRLYVRIKPVHGFVNPGGFDYERWLFVRHIRAKGYVRSKRSNHKLETPSGYPWLRMQAQVDNRLRDIIGHFQLSGLMRAIGVGVRHGVAREQKQLLRKTGTSHMMAISGLHVGLAAIASYWAGQIVRLCPPLMLYVSAQYLGMLGSLLTVWLYAGLCGMALPTLRAAIMITALCLSRLLCWPIGVQKRLAIALIVVLWWRPLSVFAPGFWLSFAAVTALCLCWQAHSDKRHWLIKALSTQWRINLGLLPVTAVFFHQINWLSFWVNLWAVPWFSIVVMPFMLAGLAVMWLVPDLAWGLFYLAHMSLWLLWCGLKSMAGLSRLNMSVAHLPVWCVMSAALGVIWLLSRVDNKSKPLGALLVLPVLLPGHSGLKYGQFELDLLDVGQGLSAVIATKHHTLVYDTGPAFSTGFNTGQAVVVPYLTYRDRLAVDTMVISHGDNDHIGGASAVLKGAEVGTVLTSVPERFPNKDRTALCKRGQSWRWDGVPFKVLAPKGESKRNNDGSCVLKIGRGSHSVLLPGDIEKFGEKALVNAAPDKLEADVLVAPHHGSNTSSTAPFVHNVKPKWVLFPTGFLNRFGFPKSSVVNRYDNIGSNTANTADTGRIQLLWDGHDWQVSLFRHHGRFWWR